MRTQRYKCSPSPYQIITLFIFADNGRGRYSTDTTQRYASCYTKSVPKLNEWSSNTYLQSMRLNGIKVPIITTVTTQLYVGRVSLVKTTDVSEKLHGVHCYSCPYQRIRKTNLRLRWGTKLPFARDKHVHKSKSLN
jgi:hypothetical protein